VRQRYEAYHVAPVTWAAGRADSPGKVIWNDHRSEDLGEDLDGGRFTLIAQQMMNGRYYPPDAIEFFGPWIDEKRELRVGDRILQRARLLPFAPYPALWAMTEVYVAEWTPLSCTLGYVTTARHFGRGIWTAKLAHSPRSHLILTIEAQTAPQSWLFWVGMPVARWLQKRAWGRAVEVFRDL
jgi:hypothetical protein